MPDPVVLTVVEKEETGRILETTLSSNGQVANKRYVASAAKERMHLMQVLANVFLPAAYPHSVSSDYLHYQIYNALQAFCSSLAGLIASRAILEGFGVGDSSASATHALLLTVLQDVFSRLTTILGAYYIGTSLFPEAKTYRLLADILNDAAITLDTLSPFLNSVSLPFNVPGLPLGSSSGLRVAALCLSGSLRALCGVAAGGSKAALTVHFATPGGGTGDIGDLNAKDASKETVLGLSGMLLGTLIVPYLTTSRSTYIALFVLLASHLAANYIAVRGVVLRTLNKQRAGIAWGVYRRSHGDAGADASITQEDKSRQRRTYPSPREVATSERIFEWPGTVRDPRTNQIAGFCDIGSSLSTVIPHFAHSKRLLRTFAEERYILCFDRSSSAGHRPLHLHVCLKEGYSTADVLKAWIHAQEVVRGQLEQPVAIGDSMNLVEQSHRTVDRLLPSFLAGMQSAGWLTDETTIIVGPPKSIFIRAEDSEVSDDGRPHEEKKNI